MIFNARVAGFLEVKKCLKKIMWALDGETVLYGLSPKLTLVSLLMKLLWKQSLT